MATTVIEGRDPLGFLAGLGLMSVVPGLRLRWSAGPYHWGEIDADVSEIVKEVWADACRYEADWIDHGSGDVDAPDALELMRGGVDADRDGIAPGWACLWMLSGQQDPMRSGRVLRSIVARDPSLIREAIVGVNGRPVMRPPEKHANLRLSHTDGVMAAHTDTRPAWAPAPVCAGQQWLAWRGVVAIGWRHHGHLDLSLWDNWRTISDWQATPAARTLRCRITRDGYGYGTISPGGLLVPSRATVETDPIYEEMADGQLQAKTLVKAAAGDQRAIDVAIDNGWL